MAKNPKSKLVVETLKHTEAKRKNIPTAEHQSVLEREQQSPKTLRYPRNTDLDPQLVWRGKDEQDWPYLVVNAPPLYIQGKMASDQWRVVSGKLVADHQPLATYFFSDFNGIPNDTGNTYAYFGLPARNLH
jgi:adenine-specific DNA-methyltransferase